MQAPLNGLPGSLEPCATPRDIAACQTTTGAVRRSPSVRSVHAGAPADTGRRRVATVRRAGSSRATTATRSPRRKRARGRPTLAATVRLPSRPQFRAPDHIPGTPDGSTSFSRGLRRSWKYTLSDSALQDRRANFYRNCRGNDPLIEWLCDRSRQQASSTPAARFAYFHLNPPRPGTDSRRGFRLGTRRS